MLLGVGGLVFAGTGVGESDVLRWTDTALGAELPHARGGAATAVWTHGSQQVLYQFGGCSEVMCFDDLHRHDMTNGRWAEERTTGKPPTRRKGHTLTLFAPFSAEARGLRRVERDGLVPSSPGVRPAESTWEVLAASGTAPAAVGAQRDGAGR